MTSKADEVSALDDLKELLLTPEKNQIQRIESRLDDPMVRAKEMSLSLPEAISLSVLHSNKISRVIRPVIDAAIKASVQEDPRALADAIFPALGPGIRKAISATILGMIQSLNQVVNHSFSIQGIKWRYEAFKTGKQFAEIVLLNTLVYQVEQIFLIHKTSGIVLEHVVAKGTIIQDPDLVSGMLTAIQEFVKDSFHAETREDIETLRMSDSRSIWIETGEHALIAAVIRGTPPLDLRITYRELIEEIHLKSKTALEQFNGDPVFFSVFREQLKDGLQFQEKKGQKKISPVLWGISLILLSLLLFWGVQSHQTQKIWQTYLSRLESQKGLIVLSARKDQDKYRISGLKDPLSIDPLTLIEPEDKDRLNLISHWQPFYSLDPELILQRVRQTLHPPDSITLSLEKNRLFARGKASYEWIDSYRRIAPSLPGIEGADDSRVLSIEQEKLDSALKQLETIKIYFENNSTEFVNGQKKILDQLVALFQKIQTLQAKLENPFQIIILGHTDSSGTEKLNQRLSRNRAEKIFNILIINDVNPGFITLSGMGTSTLLKEERSSEDKRYNRAVTFKPFYKYSTKGSNL